MDKCFWLFDFNVVFSALVTRGKSRLVFELNDIFHKFEFISTQYIYSELDDNLDRIASLSKLSEEEISEVLEFIKKSVEIIPFEEVEGLRLIDVLRIQASEY